LESSEGLIKEREEEEEEEEGEGEMKFVGWLVDRETREEGERRERERERESSCAASWVSELSE